MADQERLIAVSGCKISETRVSLATISHGTKSVFVPSEACGPAMQLGPRAFGAEGLDRRRLPGERHVERRQSRVRGTAYSSKEPLSI
jgi:hypothetical protein